MTDYSSISRNRACTCGSGLKYKKCCGKPEDVLLPRSRKSPSSLPRQMGIFQEYISRNLSPDEVEKERKLHLKTIGDLLDCDVLTYAGRVSSLPSTRQAPITVQYEDLLPFVDMLGALKNPRIAVIIETIGGSGEVGRDMVEILHEQFEHVTFIVPGTAKSTGTIMVMGGDEILMGLGSSLGPIDAQLQQDGRVYSADALLEGLERIKREVARAKGRLNPIYVPYLQRLSIGEIEHAHNALEFARKTVREWLVKYKFANWKKRMTSGKKVTNVYREKRAREIAAALSSQKRWKTHGASIRIPDLRELKVQVRDFSQEPELNEAIQRYHVLLRNTFDASPEIAKVFETTVATVVRRFRVQTESPAVQQRAPQKVDRIILNAKCPTCSVKNKAQIDFEPGLPLEKGATPFPVSGRLACAGCGTDIDIAAAKDQMEKKFGRKALISQSKGRK